MSAVAAGAQPPSYPPAGAATLLSRGWNLFRKNLKPSLLVVMVPVVIQAIAVLLMSLPQALPFLTTDKGMIAVAAIVAGLVGISASLFNFFIVGLSCLGILSRLYFQVLITGERPSLKQCARELLRRGVPYLILCGGLPVVYAVFLVADLILIIGGSFLVSMFMGLLSVPLAMVTQGGPGVLQLVLVAVFVIGMVLFFSVLGFLLITLIVTQGIITFIPLVGAANSPTPEFREVFRGALNALGLVARNLWRVLGFGILFFVFQQTLSLAFSVPVIGWAIMERLTNPETDPRQFSVIFNLVNALYSLAINLFIWPFIFATLTILWYDCRVRSEGLDLQMMLQDLRQRHLKQS